MRALAPCLLAIAVGVPAVAGAAEFSYLVGGEPGRATCAPFDPGWEYPDFDDIAWPMIAADTRALVPDAGVLPEAPTSPDAAAAVACPVVRMRRHFDVGPEIGRLASLTLRVRYHDGFVAYLNGLEVARRRLPPAAEWASEVHGPERESFPIVIRPGMLRPTNNVIAVEVRAAKRGRRVQADVALDGADGPRIVRGPYLQRIGPDEGWVVVETDLPSEVELRWWRAADRGPPHTTASATSTRHVLRFARLQPATGYRYQIALTNRTPAPDAESAETATAPTAEGEFHTPPSATGTQPLRFAVFGDVRSGHDVHASIVRAVAGEDPDLIVMTGDLVARGTDEADWERFFDIAAPLLRQVAIYPAPGNHEYYAARRGIERFLGLFLRAAPTPWWSFDVAGVHFALVDSEAYENPEQLAWLDADLAAARRRRARALFVVSHDGPYSSALHGDNRVATQMYAPIYEKHRVSMVFSGHDHDYERLHVGAVDYVVTGGGGAELRNPRCGTDGKRPCGPRTRAFANEHHYIMVEVMRDRFRLCPKRADGTLLEACPTFTLRR